MELFVIFVFTSIFSTAFAAAPAKQYRTDYEYNSRTDAFYKFHIESVRGWKAAEICTVEGAKLMTPTSQQDLVQLHSMLKKYPDLGQYVRVDTDNQVHESAEEEALINMESEEEPAGASRDCDVVTRKGEIETSKCYHAYPFICKLEAKDVPFDSNCDVYGTGYTYIPATGSCYKIPRIPFNWDQAYTECQAEHAHLVIINSETEREAVQNFTHTSPRVIGSGTHYFFFAGYRAERTKDGAPRVFKTILNQTLDEAGFNEWSPNEPNNYMDKEYCGSIFKNDGKLNDLNCKDQYAFICEKEVRIVS